MDNYQELMAAYHRLRRRVVDLECQTKDIASAVERVVEDCNARLAPLERAAHLTDQRPREKPPSEAAPPAA